MRPPGGTACPMGTAGTQISTSDTTNGVAMVFTTSGDVADLRARVRRMADMHNQMAGMQGSGAPGGGPKGPGMGMGMMKMIPSHASVEEVPGGARLVLVPADPSQLAPLRQQVRMHAEMMQSGRCPQCPMCPVPGAESEQPPAGGTTGGR